MRNFPLGVLGGMVIGNSMATGDKRMLVIGIVMIWAAVNP